MSQGKAYVLLTGHLITGKQLRRSEPAQEKRFKYNHPVHISLTVLLGWLYFQAHYASHHIFMLGRCPIKWRQRLDITISVDWDAEPQIKQTKRTKNCDVVFV